MTHTTPRHTTEQEKAWGALQETTETGTLTELLTLIQEPHSYLRPHLGKLLRRIIKAKCLVMLCPTGDAVTVEITRAGVLELLTLEGPIELEAYKASRLLGQYGPFATDPTRRGLLREIPD